MEEDICLTKFVKNTFLLVIMAIMLMAGTVTAFAEDGVENPYIETISGVSVKAAKVAEIVITNPKIAEPTPDDPFGELLLTKRASGTGKLLPGAVFGVYRASDGIKVEEITTGSDGTAILSLEPNNYYCVELKAPTGFILDSTRIPFTIKDGVTVEVDVTNIPVQDEPKPDEAKPTLPVITIPKTGEAFPAMTYALSALCLGVALICGVKLRRKKA